MGQYHGDRGKSPFIRGIKFCKANMTCNLKTVGAWNAVSLLVRDLFNYKVQKSWARWDEQEK